MNIPILVPRATSIYKGQDGSSPEGLPFKSNLTSPIRVYYGFNTSILDNL